MAIKGITLLPWQRTNIAIAAATAGVLSIFGSLFIIIAHLMTTRKSKSSLTSYIVFIMSLLDLFSSTWIVIMSSLKISGSLDAFKALCGWQGWVQMFFYSSVNYWTLVFAIQLYLQIVKKSSLEGEKKMRIVHAIVWGTSSLLSIVPLLGTSFASYGDSGAVCFIAPGNALARQVLYYIPVYLIILAIVVLYVIVIRTLIAFRNQAENSGIHADHINRNLFVKLGLYPIVFIVIWLPNSFNRLYEAFNDPSYEFTMIQAALLPAQGFLNFMIYGVSTGLFSRLVKRTTTHSSSRPIKSGSARVSNAAEHPPKSDILKKSEPVKSNILKSDVV